MNRQHYLWNVDFYNLIPVVQLFYSNYLHDYIMKWSKNCQMVMILYECVRYGYWFRESWKHCLPANYWTIRTAVLRAKPPNEFPLGFLLLTLSDSFQYSSTEKCSENILQAFTNNIQVLIEITSSGEMLLYLLSL